MNRDIVVIGAGIVGCAIAYELARRGASVEIVDSRQPVGMGATQASAGVLAPYIEARDGNPLLELGVRSLHLFDDFIARVSSASGISVAYERTGTIDVAVDEAEMETLRATAEVLARRGVAARLVDRAAAHAEEPQVTDDVIGALVIDAHGFVIASELTRALSVAARRHGAQLIEQSRVRRIARSGDELVVETDRGPLTAAAVVLAAGSWSGTIEIDGVRTPPPVRPVRGQLLQLAWNGPPLKRVTWSRKCYMVPWDDGSLLVGATVEEAGFDERATVAGVRDLLEAACDVVPQAWNAGFRAARVGLRPGTSDNLPIVGPSAALPGLFFATGHYRNGVLLAPLTAELVAAAMIDNRFDPMLTPIGPARFGL
jgi:glycine oxidase